MNESFSVGEIAIIAKSMLGISTGRECEITEPLKERWILWPTGQRCEPCYAISLDGKRYLLPPSWLRKKRPPREDLTVVSWDTVPWWPEQKVRELS